MIKITEYFNGQSHRDAGTASFNSIRRDFRDEMMTDVKEKWEENERFLHGRYPTDEQFANLIATEEGYCNMWNSYSDGTTAPEGVMPKVHLGVLPDGDTI